MCKIMEELIMETRIEEAVTYIKSLMKSLDKTSTEAMELLNIPEELKPQIVAAIEC